MHEKEKNSEPPTSAPEPQHGSANAPSPIKASILVRVKTLYLVLSVISLAILVKIIWVQTGTASDELRGQGVSYSFRTELIEPMRGNILAADGRILTTTLPIFDLRLDLMAQGLTDKAFNSNIHGLCDSLASFFGDQSAQQYMAKIKRARTLKQRYFKFVPRRVNFVELQRIEKFPLLALGQNSGGFIAEASNRRVRPMGNVASRTIGFVNSTGTKVGIEGGFDDVLRGTDGLVVKQKISGDFWIPIASDLNVDPTPGMDVQTTIDIEMQDIVQTALRERLNEVEADWGSVVIMEVATGHIKAIANATRRDSSNVVEDFNYAFGRSMEPGSTFKLASLIAMLDEAHMPITEMVDTQGGVAKFGSLTVRDSHSGGYGVIDMQRAFELSSNVAFAKAVNRHFAGRTVQFINEIYKMGIGKHLGLQITGEGDPLIKDPTKTKYSKETQNDKDKWDQTTLTMMGFGYGLHVTPLQLLSLYNAVANNGRMVKPQIVSALINKGEVVRQYPTEVIREQIASPQTIKIVQRALRGVVEAGTARALRNDKYTVAAKTGTAQIPTGKQGYTAADGSRQYLGSIAGYFPAENPRYSIIIAIKTVSRPGSGKPYYGGSLASPLFRTIADRIYGSSFHFLRPVSATQFTDLTHRTTERQSTDYLATDSLGRPIVMGMDARTALVKLEKNGYKVKIAGHGVVDSYTIDTINNKMITLFLK
ncbi:MAG: penicillin-binding protein 2 [Mucinivorans sp.]